MDRLIALSALAFLVTAACAGAPPRASLAAVAGARTGDVHDFDYFAGAWTTRQHRLKARGVGSGDWDDFPATLCMTPYLEGMATVDEIYFPTKGWAGLTLRTFDPVKRQWSKLYRERARWEQAFAYDGSTWETNWTADFLRGDPGVICEGGRPRRESSPRAGEPTQPKAQGTAR